MESKKSLLVDEENLEAHKAGVATLEAELK